MTTPTLEELHSWGYDGPNGLEQYRRDCIELGHDPAPILRLARRTMNPLYALGAIGLGIICGLFGRELGLSLFDHLALFFGAALLYTAIGPDFYE